MFLWSSFCVGFPKLYCMSSSMYYVFLNGGIIRGNGARLFSQFHCGNALSGSIYLGRYYFFAFLYRGEKLSPQIHSAAKYIAPK